MSISEYYKDLRRRFGSDLIFMPAVVGIIRNEDNEILFGRKHDEDTWGLIAGAIEVGENPAEAAIREVFEETGLVVIPEKIIGIFGGTLKPDNDEIKDLKYFKETDIPEIQISYPKEIFIKGYSERAIFE